EDLEHRRLAGEEQREDLLGELARALEDDLIGDVGEAVAQAGGDALGGGDFFEDDAIGARLAGLDELDVEGEAVAEFAREDELHLAGDEVVRLAAEQREGDPLADKRRAA